MPFVQTNLDREKFRILKDMAVKRGLALKELVRNILTDEIRNHSTQETITNVQEQRSSND